MREIEPKEEEEEERERLNNVRKLSYKVGGREFRIQEGQFEKRKKKRVTSFHCMH
jgi:hypothetical protein